MVWVLILCWDLENYKAPSGVTCGTKTTRGFTECFYLIKKIFLKFPYCPWYPKPCHPVGTSTLPRAPAHSQHHMTTSNKVGLLAFQFIYHTCNKSLLHILRILSYGHRIIFANTNFILSFHRSNHQQFWCQSAAHVSHKGLRASLVQ